MSDKDSLKYNQKEQAAVFLAFENSLILKKNSIIKSEK